MKRIHILGGVLAAAGLAGGGAALTTALLGGPDATPGTAYGAPPAAISAPAPQIGAEALPPGTALVDGTGRALYLFEADSGTMSTCTGACAQVWPPLLTTGGTPGQSGAVQAPLVGSSPRTDGTRQVTYNGHPLYYFAGDKAPGDVKGQGINNFGGSWYLVSPNGDEIDSDAAPVASSGPANGY